MKEQMKRGQFVIFLAILVLISGCQSKVEDPFIKGPYLQKIKQTEMTIVWECDTTYSGKVFYGKEENLDLTAEINGISKVQKVVLKNLEPETEYSYQVEVNGFKSSKHTFRTAVKKGSPFSFAAYGDNKNGPFNHKRIADLILKYKPLFVANNGDLVERGYVYNQWGKLFFTPANDMMAEIPLVPAIGNHEKNAEYYYNYFYVASIVFGAVASLTSIISLIDAAYALMSIPTMISAIILAPKVKKAAKKYFAELRMG